MEGDHLLITAAGAIENIESYELLTEVYINEILEQNVSKTIVDETELEYLKSVLLQSDIVKYYAQKMPREMRDWTVAVIVDDVVWEFAVFWESVCHRVGYHSYKVFTSMEEAKEFVSSY